MRGGRVIQRTRTPRIGARGRGALLCAALIVAGCPGDDAPDTAGSEAPSPPPETTPELRARAQAAALSRLRPLATAALRLDRPAFASRWSDTRASLPPTDAGARETLRDALRSAQDDAKGLRPQSLPPQDRAVALLLRFGLDRSHDRVFRQRPSRTDPDWVLSEIAALLDVVEVEARLTGSCGTCADALAGIGGALDHARTDLGATSAPVLAAAQTHAAALGLRLAALPLEATLTQPSIDALSAYQSSLSALTLPAAPNATYDDTISPAADASAVRRLPDRLGARSLGRWLEVEENISATPTVLFTSLGRSVSQLGKLRTAYPAQPVAPPAALTEDRCAQAWAPLATFAEQTPAVEAGAFSCTTFASGWGTAPLDATELALVLIDLGLVEPHRRAQLDATAEAIRAVPGRIAQASQRHTMRTAIAMGAKQASAGVAIAREHDAACLAATAVWIHGEVGEDAALAKRLTAHCPSQTPQSWIEAAEARPRKALEGLGLARVSDGPAGLVSLDRYWWAPLGFIDLLADPGRTTPAPAATVKMKIEPVDPQPGAQP